MNPAILPTHLSVEEYLAGEEHSELRHEYIDGVAYAMAGGSEAHNLICGAFYTALRSKLAGTGCRVFIGDVKARLRLAEKDLFYYPDVMVACDPRDTHPFYKQHPKLIVEVLSPSTERIDREEKRASYFQLVSLEEYILAAQDSCSVTVYRRKNAWQPETLQNPGDTVTLQSVDLSIPLAEIYRDVGLGLS